MRAGGNRYFALDVTDRNDPRLLWSIGATELPGVGQSWSPPTIARVSVGTGGSANTSAERFVLIFGGGYDTGQETQPYKTDAVGNRIFMVDAESGNRLWFGGGAGTGTPDVTFAKMTNSIPGRIRVIDTDGDLFADRMYAADMGGRVWRFDITNGQPAASLVAGGVIAQLGVGSNSPAPGNADNRRFYNAPDVALIQRRAEDPYYNIAIGSGYRGHPLDAVTQDRFYAIRDKMPYARLTQAQYNAVTPLLDSDLVDITADPAGSTVMPIHAGWKFVLPAQAGRAGEKVLAEATTVNNVLLFTTFQPLPPSGTDPCYPANINRAYAMRADTGKPALDFNDDGVTDNSDISVDLRQTGIVGDITVALIRQANQDPNSPPSSRRPRASRASCSASASARAGRCARSGSATMPTDHEEPCTMQTTERGVTLIELLTVIVVLGILASIAVPSYRNYLIRAQRTEATTALLQLQAAQEKFYLQNNAYTDQVAAAPPAGLGLMATTERGFYNIAVALGAGNQTYTATALPVAGAGQSDDSRAPAFDHGYRLSSSTGPGGRDLCWR